VSRRFSGAISVTDLDRIEIAPHPQRSFLRIRFEIVPPIECTPSLQQILESCVSASFPENLLKTTDVVWQELAGEVQHERFS
jgi:hypothetical protein